MATLWAHVFEGAGLTPSGPVIQRLSVTVDGTARFTSALTSDSNKKKVVRIFTDTDCHFNFGAAGTDADTADEPLGAENPEYIEVRSGHVIGVIQRV